MISCFLFKVVHLQVYVDFDKYFSFNTNIIDTRGHWRELKNLIALDKAVGNFFL